LFYFRAINNLTFPSILYQHVHANVATKRVLISKLMLMTFIAITQHNFIELIS